MELEHVSNFFGHVLDIRLVPLGDDDHLDSSAVSTEDFLLQPADRQNATTQGDLARHRYILTYRTIRHLRDERCRNRDSGRWTVLRDRTRRHVNVRFDGAEP